MVKQQTLNLLSGGSSPSGLTKPIYHSTNLARQHFSLDKCAGKEYNCLMNWIEGDAEVVDAVWERRASARWTRRKIDNQWMLIMLMSASLAWFALGMLVGVWVS